MKEGIIAASEDSLLELRERKKLFDDIWLLTIFIMLLAAGVPWYLRILAIDLGPLIWGLFGFGLLNLTVNLLLEGLQSRRDVLVLIGLQQWVGIVFVGFLWHNSGNIQNPLFLIVLVLPMIAGSLVMLPWQSYAAAVLSIGTIFTIAWLDAPDLRWNTLQIHLFPGWFARILPGPLAAPPQPFPSLNTTPAYLFTLLLSFAIGVVAVVLVSESWNSYVVRLYNRLSYSAHALDDAESLSSEVLRATPWPCALVYKDAFQIAKASETFLQYLFLSPEQVQRESLFSLVHFSDPEAIEDLITGNGGEVPFAVYRVGHELRIARVRVHSIQHEGLGLAYVSLEDLTNEHCLQVALNAVEQPLLVLSGAQRVLYFNPAAKEVFAGLNMGADASSHLQVANLPSGWWEMGAHSRRERQLEVSRYRYRAICVAGRIPGEKEALTIVSLQAMGSGT